MDAFQVDILSVILGYSSVLVHDVTEGSPFRGDLQAIESAAQRAATLTSQLLAFSRKQVIQPREVDLNEVIAAMRDIMRRLLGADIELVTLPARELAMVFADPSQLEQVVMNLAANARDAMPQGGIVTIETTDIHIDEGLSGRTSLPPGPYVMLAFRDNGIGIDAATQARIFEPFFTTKQDKGTGLGLSTVFGIVKHSGGTVLVESEPGRGAVFRIYLPARPREPARMETAPSVAPRASGGSETVLLAEDDGQVRTLVASLLTRGGYTVLEAEDGPRALLIGEQHSGTIHLLLTDVVMPQMSGRQLADRLAALRPRMKVMYMSGFADDNVLRERAKQGVAFLQKPVTAEALLSKVRDVLDEGGG